MPRKVTSSISRGITPPAILISVASFIVQIKNWKQISIPDDVVYNGVAVMYGVCVGMQTTTASNLNSPGVVPVSAISLCFKTNGNSTNSMSLNISGTSVGWKAIATA